jgi:hypothetical protein
MSDVVAFTLAGLIIGTCGRYSSTRGLGWVMTFVGFVTAIAIRVLEAVMMIGV